MKHRGLYGILLKWQNWFENHILFRAIRRAMIYLIPLVLIGSFALLLLSLPIQGYQDFMLSLFGDKWGNLLQFVRDGTSNILSPLMVICISYAYANEYNTSHRHVSPILTVATSLASFMALLGMSKSGFTTDSFGPSGMFFAIVVACSASALFLRLYSVRFLRIASFSNGADASFNHAASAVLPMALTIGVFALVDMVFDRFFGIPSFSVFLSDQMVALFSHIASPFLSVLLFVALVQGFWLFGMHGNNILEPVAQKFFVPGVTENYIQLLSGLAPTHIVTKSFLDCFVFMGGCGATLCLLCAILFAGKHKHHLRLARISAVPVLFNISEMLVLGLPVVLNPIFLIPFLLVPALLTVISFLAIQWGLVPMAIHPTEWTTPIFLNGYISTGSFSACWLQLFNLIVGTLCYLPFVRLSEQAADSQIRVHLEKVYRAFQKLENRGVVSTLLARQDDVGTVSRRLLADLEDDLNHDRLQIHYQPQVSFDGDVRGMEALLRWNHRHYGWVQPPLIIALAEEAGLIHRLGEWILNSVCADRAHLRAAGIPAPTMAVNISAMQLEDGEFQAKVAAALARHGIAPGELEIEITEHIALGGSPRMQQQLQRVQAMGVRLAMDDFGMGHSSLLYLKEYRFDTVKLDGSLVRELIDSDTCRNIVSSIAQLGSVLQYSVVAEYVETDEQKQVLHCLGCDTYQGYLYSRAVPLQAAEDFLLQHHAADPSLAEDTDTRMDCG